jgi:hypothetical protein
VESFNVRLRDELLDGEIFYSPRKAQVVIERWRRHSNMVRPHASLGNPCAGSQGGPRINAASYSDHGCQTAHPPTSNTDHTMGAGH